MSSIPTLGPETQRKLRIKFENIHHLNAEQSEFGQFGYKDQIVNSEWLTFRSGAINMLELQRELIEK